MQVSVLGAFDFSAADGSRPTLSAGGQRLVAYLALRPDPVARATAAEALWPDASSDHASSSLRSALSRLGAGPRDALALDANTLGLSADVAVDLRASRDLAWRLLDDAAPADDVHAGTIATLTREVLPDWYDDWVVADAEEWRRLRVAALEAISDRLAHEGRFAHAMSAALSAVHVEPLRERATAAVIRVHLAEGNRAEGLREFRRYRARLQRELGVDPTDALYALVGVAPAATRRRGDGHPLAPKWDELRGVREGVARIRKIGARRM